MTQAVTRAVLTGIIVSIWLLAGYSILTLLYPGVYKTTLRTLTGAIGLVVLFIGILSGMKARRRTYSSEQFTYLNAFKSGLIVSVIVALIVSLASFVYVKFINPQLADDMVREAEASLKASGATPQEITEKLNAVHKEFSLGAQLTGPLIVQTGAGIIFSLVLAFFLKKK